MLLREGVESQWTNATAIDTELDVTDDPCQVVKEMLDVFHKYTK